LERVHPLELVVPELHLPQGRQGQTLPHKPESRRQKTGDIKIMRKKK